MLPNRKKFTLDFNIKMELIVQGLMIPGFVYYNIFTSTLHGQEVLTLLFCAFCGLVLVLTPTILYRNYFFRKISAVFAKTDSDENEILVLRRLILNYPTKEAIIISLRWIVGTSSTIVIMVSAFGLSYFKLPLLVYNVALILPLSSLCTFFVAEYRLMALLKQPLFKQVSHIAIGNKNFTFFLRISLSFFSILSLPVGMLSLFVIAPELFDKSLHEKLIFLSVMMAWVVILIITTSIFFVRSTSESIKNLLLSIQNLEQGNLQIDNP
ncbi:MAG: hypothetical protein AAF518_28920, partial [Spirochaetota bacterium]